MPEYSVVLPIWDSHGLVDENYPKISHELRQRLIEFQARWESTQDDPRADAVVQQSMDQLKSDGLALLRKLQDELGPEYDVVFRL